MSCKNIIKMELLTEDEAWNLFSDKVGLHVTPDLEKDMKLVADECARLPLAIITIAGSMNGIVDTIEWRNAYKELNASPKGLSDMGIKVLDRLKFSYTHLKDEKLKQCLLYCALFPGDFMINRKELIAYMIDEGIIREMESRQAEFDKGHAMLNTLENVCLLGSITSYNNVQCVKMHDLIRDKALQIMSTSPHFLVEAGVQLRKVPNEEKWTKDLERVSLMKNSLLEIPDGTSPRCPRISTLLLHNNPLKRLPNPFFVQMHGLKVLDLSETDIQSLSNSISDLETLTALLLRRCRILRHVPSLAKLRALRRLDLSYTKIKEVPQNMENLVNLIYLNLYAEYLEMLPAGILPRLSRLQFFIANWSSDTFKVKGEELAGLEKLETFAGLFCDQHGFNKYARSWREQGPDKYLLQVGENGAFVHSYEEESYFNKDVRLRKCSIGRRGKNALMLPKDIKSLRIDECHDVKSLCDVSSLENATDLKFCKIQRCNGIESVFSVSTCTPFQSLESLEISYLWNLCDLFSRVGATSPKLPAGAFSCLRILRIWYCPNVKKLFMPWLLSRLLNLEEIHVYDCKQMDEIIAENMGESSSSSITNDNSIIISLPKLKVLKLLRLQGLKSICRGTIVCDSIQELDIQECPQLKRLPVSLPLLDGQLSPPRFLNKIKASSEWWKSLTWDCQGAENIISGFLQTVDNGSDLDSDINVTYL